MNKSSPRWGITQRLVALAATVTLALAGVATLAFVMLTDIQADADRAEKSRAPRTAAMATSELNITRASLQLRHAMLAPLMVEFWRLADENAEAWATACNTSVKASPRTLPASRPVPSGGGWRC